MLIKKGDIYQLGDHILACGDSTNKQLVAQVTGQQQIKSIITDPPYGVSYVETSFSNSQQHKKILNERAD